MNLRRHWGTVLQNYFEKRGSLAGVIVVMDARHPLTDNDQEMIELTKIRSLPLHILLTKSDKLSRSAAMTTLKSARNALGQTASIQLFSATAKTGVDEAREVLQKWLTATEV